MVVLELFAPQAVGGACEPEDAVVVEPLDWDGVRAAIAAEGG